MDYGEPDKAASGKNPDDGKRVSQTCASIPEKLLADGEDPCAHCLNGLNALPIPLTHHAWILSAISIAAAGLLSWVALHTNLEISFVFGAEFAVVALMLVIAYLVAQLTRQHHLVCKQAREAKLCQRACFDESSEVADRHNDKCESGSEDRSGACESGGGGACACEGEGEAGGTCAGAAKAARNAGETEGGSGSANASASTNTSAHGSKNAETNAGANAGSSESGDASPARDDGSVTFSACSAPLTAQRNCPYSPYSLQASASSQAASIISPRPFTRADADDPITFRCKQLARIHDLSGRETEVLILLARGYDRREIEKALVVSGNTVKSHRRSIYRKLEVHSRDELNRLFDKQRALLRDYELMQMQRKTQGEKIQGEKTQKDAE